MTAHNLHRLTNVANNIEAWRDWNAIADKAREIGLGARVALLAPKDGASWHGVDRQIGKLRDEMEKAKHDKP